MRGEQWLRGTVWAVFCGAIVTFAAAVTFAAPEPSLWVRNGSPTRTLLEDNVTMTDALRNPECISKTVDVLDKFVIDQGFFTNVKPIYAQSTNTCWRVQSGGMYANNGVGTIQLNGLGSMIRLGDPYYSFTFAGDKIVKWGGGPLSYYSSLRIIPNPRDAAVVTKQPNTPYYINFADKPSNWQLMDPGTTNPLYVKDRNISPNGTWLAVASTWGLIRVNLDTREMVPFDVAGGESYNSYGFTISDDGRYIIVVENGSARIYDLATCITTGLIGRKIATGCGKRDLGSIVRPTSATSEILTLRFNALGDGFTYYAKENNVWKRYSVTAPGVAEHGIDYLALGDSYTSGEGDGDGKNYYLPGTDGDGARVPLFVTGIDNYPYDKEKCHLSSRSYPYLLAGYASLHADGFRSVACSGADANDVGNIKTDGLSLDAFNGHFNQLEFIDSTPLINSIKGIAVNNFIPGRAAQIEFVAKYKPKVLTIGLSGNDIDFGSKLTECLINLEETCRYATIDRLETVRDIKDNIYFRFSELLKKIKSASPTTRIYAVGYAQLIGHGECNGNVLLDATERDYVRASLTYVNDTIEAAAALAGVNYLDIENSLKYVNLCSGKKYPAINGLTHGNDQFGIFGNESYHPNEQGHALIATAIRNTLHDTSIVDYSPCATPAILHCNAAATSFPNPPDFFMTSSSGGSTIKTIRQVLISDQEVSKIFTTVSGIVVAFQDPGTLLNPNSDVYAILKSTPVNLSPSQQLKADDKGWVNANLQIPAGTEPGVHTLHLIGTMRSGEPVDYYQPILVVASMNDYDGDGITNADDMCQFVMPSGVDSDEDDIDDACEGDLRPHTKPVVTPPVVTSPGESKPVEQAQPSNAVLGASTSTGASTPYQGPIIALQGLSNSTRPYGADESGVDSEPETSSTTTGQAILPGQVSTPALQDQTANHTHFLWYAAAGAFVVMVTGFVIYRLRR